MTTERNERKISAMRAAIHGATVRWLPIVDDLFDVFHDNRSGFNIIFNNLVIVFKHLLYYIHEIIMRQNDTKNKS